MVAQCSLFGLTCKKIVELAAEKLCVFLGEIVPLLRQIVKGKNGRNGANGDARATIYALYRVDVEHRFALEFGAVFLWVNAVDRTGVHTSGVFGSNTGFGYNVGHLLI